ncbi:helix-turn-helix transcriptional regulator [Phytohabitans houttuyneae]|uniref:helix-turn-helix transcriptional regulator n=1 Tax=Phytohabitans houttuyneae TaxID=1076126 RepID=UPI001563D867|nr:helix-turn-helix transcriptional regulator [Phytohabitans houttuyneae]
MTSGPVRVRVRNGPAVAHYPPGATLGPRVLPCFEFVWMLDGQATWHHSGRAPGATPATVPLRPGLLLLSRPDLRESYTWDPERPCAHGYVSFYADGAGDHRDWPTTREQSEPLAALCRYLLWLSSAGSPGAAERTADVLSWLLDVFVRGPLGADAEELPEHVRRLGDHLHAAWRAGPARPMSLSELAAAAQVSPGHLARLFRQRFGTGPVAAVELIRLARAATLLQRSSLTVGAVAEVCGFANPFHLSRRFRVTYGLPPRAYRAAPHLDPLEPVRRAGLLPLARQLLADYP